LYFREPTSKVRERKGKERKGEGMGKGKEKIGKGRKGKEKGKGGRVPPPLQSSFDHCLRHRVDNSGLACADFYGTTGAHVRLVDQG